MSRATPIDNRIGQHCTPVGISFCSPTAPLPCSDPWRPQTIDDRASSCFGGKHPSAYKQLMCAQIRQRVVSGQRTHLPYLDRVLEGDYQRSGVPTFDFLVFQDFVEKARQREIGKGRDRRGRRRESSRNTVSQPFSTSSSSKMLSLHQ